MKLGLLATAMYPLGTSAALGEMPQDLLQEVLKGPSSWMDRVSSFNTTLENKLSHRTIDELRQIEYEVKHDVKVSQDLLGLEKYSKSELLEQIEDSKRAIKGR